MDTSKFIKKLFTANSLYVWLIGVLGVVAFFFHRVLGIAELILFAALLIFNFLHNKQRTEMVLELVDNLTLDVDQAAKSSLMNFPLPTVMLRLDGKITWYNEGFEEIFGTEHLFEVDIQTLVEGFSLSDVVDTEKQTIETNVRYGDRFFHVIGNLSALPEDSKYLVVLYWQETTALHTLEKRLDNERVFIGMVLLDNYDELMQNTKESTKPQLIAQIEKNVNDWVGQFGGLLYKCERDKYVVLFQYRQLEAILRNKFELLNKMRAIDLDNKIPVTVSIGLGVDGEDMVENNSYAQEAINMALGRGGDQAVVKDRQQFRFYGGGNKEYEKSTRVKARVVSFALKGLIANASNVVIMGHKNADIDSFGAAFGLQRACKQLGKPVNILLGNHDNTVKNMLERLENEEEYTGLFVNNQQAEDMVREDTLLIVVDTHKPGYVENSHILGKTKHIVVLDHHRRGAEFIENTALVYHEPYASSTCEMVTEVLQYIDDRLDLRKLEAEALYAGIAIDTKHFTFKTGVRTFEAASYLRKHGVDTVAIKTMFQQDLTTFVRKAEIIKNATILRDHIALSTCKVTGEDYQVLVAQAADEMLGIKGIQASFVLCETKEFISISGRSLGSINVQVILEKLGGGGHLTMAGAQLYDVTLSEAQERLVAAIDDYFDEAID